VPILKNDGVRQWEGLYIPYMKWKISYPLVMTNSLLLKIAIEIVDFPIKNSDFL